MTHPPKGSLLGRRARRALGDAAESSGSIVQRENTVFAMPKCEFESRWIHCLKGLSVQWEDARLADARSEFDSPQLHERCSAVWCLHATMMPQGEASAYEAEVLVRFQSSR